MPQGMHVRVVSSLRLTNAIVWYNVPMRTFYTKQLLEKIVPDCYSVAQVIEKLGRKKAGGTHALVKRKLNEYEIDYSHFTGQGWNKGGGALNRKSWQDILILRPEGSYRTKAPQLRRLW